MKLQLQHQSNEYSGLISFRMNCFDLLAVQGTLQSLFQHHSSKASILGHSAFFIVQLSHLYMTTGKTIALTIQIFVGKVLSLLFKILSRFDIAILLPRSKCLLISWLQSPSTLILEPKKMKSDRFHLFPIYLPRSDLTSSPIQLPIFPNPPLLPHYPEIFLQFPHSGTICSLSVSQSTSFSLPERSNSKLQ